MKLFELDSEHCDATLRMLNDFRTGPAPILDPSLSEVFSRTHFANFLEQAQTERRDWRPKAKQVSQTRYILLSDRNEVCGLGWLRFPLNPELELSGGNLVFDVPPSKRGQGFGTLTLNGLLFEAVRAGLARALVNCQTDNLAARRCIEKNRGELSLSEGNNTLASYWIRFR